MVALIHWAGILKIPVFGATINNQKIVPLLAFFLSQVNNNPGNLVFAFLTEVPYHNSTSTRGMLPLVWRTDGLVQPSVLHPATPAGGQAEPL
jgi:hypothetical protein